MTVFMLPAWCVHGFSRDSQDHLLLTCEEAVGFFLTRAERPAFLLVIHDHYVRCTQLARVFFTQRIAVLIMLHWMLAV